MLATHCCCCCCLGSPRSQSVRRFEATVPVPVPYPTVHTPRALLRGPQSSAGFYGGLNPYRIVGAVYTSKHFAEVVYTAQSTCCPVQSVPPLLRPAKSRIIFARRFLNPDAYSPPRVLTLCLCLRSRCLLPSTKVAHPREGPYM